MKHCSDALHLGRRLSLPTTITLGWKGLPGTNTIAYFKYSKITAAKCVCSVGHSLEKLARTNALALLASSSVTRKKIHKNDFYQEVWAVIGLSFRHQPRCAASLEGFLGHLESGIL